MASTSGQGGAAAHASVPAHDAAGGAHGGGGGSRHVSFSGDTVLHVRPPWRHPAGTARSGTTFLKTLRALPGLTRFMDVWPKACACSSAKARSTQMLHVVIELFFRGS